MARRFGPRHRAADLVERVSPTAAAAIDWVHPARFAPWGGAMNGQEGRQRLVRALVAAWPPALVVETGTYRGATTDFLRAATGAPVVTVEISARFHRFCTWRFAGRAGIDLRRADSSAVLDELGVGTGLLAYLDAHDATDLPLAEELHLVTTRWRGYVAIVDDARVPGDDGYGWDDYGPGRCIDLGYVRDAVAGNGASVYAPALPSAEETGARRGCLVVSDLPPALLQAAGLRPVPAPEPRAPRPGPAG